MKANAADKPDNFDKAVGMIILTVILMLGVALLACYVGCSGGGTFIVVFVLVLGWALALAMCISVLRKLKGKRKSQYEPMPQKG